MIGAVVVIKCLGILAIRNAISVGDAIHNMFLNFLSRSHPHKKGRLRLPSTSPFHLRNYTDQEAWAHIQPGAPALRPGPRRPAMGPARARLHDVLTAAPTDQLQLMDALTGEVQLL